MKKLTFLLFGLLLAVGWTSSVSAQALPQGGYAERLGLASVTTGGINLANATKKMASAQVTPMLPGADNSAVESPRMNAPKRVAGESDVVKDKLYYQQFKYSWTDGATGETHTNVDPTEPASNPYQIYELLRFVYGNPNFPGPTYSAYKPSYQREDEVYYGAINGGWDITAGSGGAAMTTHDITITASSYYASFKSITVYDMNGNVLTSWDAQTAIDNGEYTSYTASDGTRYRFTLPGWSSDYYMGILNAGTESDIIYVGYLASGTTTPGTITIPYSLLNGQTQVRVVINANHDYEAGDEGDANQTLTVNGEEKALTGDFADYTWDNIVVADQPDEDAFVQGTVVPPYEDGYTVLVVALKNREDMTLETELWPANSTHFEQKSQLITYFQNNVEYVKLLTDGLRIGKKEDHTSGTVFNCDGNYNRFFFLGKGQARKKAPRIQAFIDQGGNITFGQFRVNNTYYTTVNYQDWFGEDVPFEEMFEQFSPTSVKVSDESQTTDFFDKLKEGNVYDVQHDCGSVMQAEHEFSLSGKNGTDHYAFSGLNFFVPDYRLLFWDTTYTYNSSTYNVDGRDNVPYESAATSGGQYTGEHGAYFSGIYDDYQSGYYGHDRTWYSAWSAYYAVYNKKYAPKVGIYKITLDASATQVGTSQAPDNENFLVTLTWVSSLDEMTGHPVPQIYTVYYWDPVTGERKYVVAEGITDGKTGLTTVSYLVPQHEHSYVIEYIVMGTPNDNDHPAFVAWSNRDNVVIPGWNDFVGLVLDHHESDFIISENSRDNWYRNFLAMVNEDIYNGLTISKISGYNEDDPSTPLTPMNSFNLYRYEYNNGVASGAMEKIANITFDQPSAEKVHYKVTYEPGQQIEQYNVMEGNSVAIANAYQRSVMGIPDEGWVRVKGNGDIVIWPSSYFVNIKSITVKNGNTTLTSWNASSANLTTDNANLPSSWIMSPGSKVIPYVQSTTGETVGFVEGGGYIAIPNLLNQYPNLTVEIVACNDGSHVTTIAVNDESQDVLGSAWKSYTWPNSSDPISPFAAPKRADRETITYYQKVTSAADFTSGDEYLIVNEAASQAMNGSLTNFGASGTNAFSVNISDGRIESNETTDARTFTITGSGSSYTVKSASGYYIGRVSGGSGGAVIQSQTTAYDHTIYLDTSNSDGRFFFRCDEGSTYWYYLRFNSSSAQFRYYTSQSQQPIYLYKKVTEEVGPAEGGLLRLHLLMVDQLKANIPDDNSHPDGYGYVLKYEPEGGEAKESGRVRVNIQKTDCDVMGYYTLDQIDRDTNRGLTMDVITADVEYDLSDDNDLLNYYYLQGAEGALPTLNQNYLSKLQRQEDFTYREMYDESPNVGEVYPNGEHHYYNNTPSTGHYGKADEYVSYAPSVSTWGIERRYFEDDGLDNTYGGPIWKTSAGEVKMSTQKTPVAERQQNSSNSVNWTTADNKAASLYILDNIEAIGKLPHTALTKIQFEPYMFRVFVESENGKLRPYQVVEANPANTDQPGWHLEPKEGELTEADTHGPLCVWSGYIKFDENGHMTDDAANGVEVSTGVEEGQTTYIYHKNKVAQPAGSTTAWGEHNAIFGALDELVISGYDNNGQPIMTTSIDEKDLKVYVRFYFNVKGMAEGHTPWTRAGETGRPGNGSESDATPPSPFTAVHEIAYTGEVVSRTYVNALGMQSDQPFDGVNIVITRYSDGKVSTAKVVR